MTYPIDANHVSSAWYPLPPGAPADVAAYIDGLFEDEIRGWVVDVALPGRLLTVCIRINGAFAGKTTACLNRGDLAQLFQSRGLHGFAFRVPDRFFVENVWNLEILLEDGRYLAPKPLTIENPSGVSGPRAPVRHPCLLFIHIPRTGGTALRSALNQQTYLSRRLVLYPDPPGFPGEYLLCLTESQLANLECVYGHFGFRLHKCMPQPCEYAAVLREPVARTLSQFLFLSRNAAPGSHPATTMTADEFFSKAIDVDFDNLMTRLVSGETADILPLGGVNESVFQHAVDNLHTWFTYVGLQEQLDETVRQLAERLSPKKLEFENVGNPEGAMSISPATVRALGRTNEYDIRLYDYVREHFWASGQTGWVRPRPTAGALRA